MFMCKQLRVSPDSNEKKSVTGAVWSSVCSQTGELKLYFYTHDLYVDHKHTFVYFPC